MVQGTRNHAPVVVCKRRVYVAKGRGDGRCEACVASPSSLRREASTHSFSEETVRVGRLGVDTMRGLLVRKHGGCGCRANGARVRVEQAAPNGDGNRHRRAAREHVSARVQTGSQGHGQTSDDEA